jgi:DNA-binding transcriptional MerR regulator
MLWALRTRMRRLRQNGTIVNGRFPRWSRHYGLTLRALRFYEARGLLKPHRFGGARFYTARDRSRLTLILAAKQMGFTLTETAQMMGKSSDAEIARFAAVATCCQTQIDYLERSRETIETALVQLRARLARMAEAGG